MANANLFQQYLQPPKSVMEYSADMDRADMGRLALISQQRSNELAGMQIGAQRSAAQLQAAKQNALQALANDPAMADPVARETALLNHPLLSAEGQALRKSRLEAEKAKADTDKTKADSGKTAWETRRAMADKALQDIARFTSPQAAAADIIRRVEAGELEEQAAQGLLSSMPQDPIQFPAWQVQMQRSIMTASEQEKARQEEMARVAPKPTEVRLGNRVAFIDTNPNSKTFKQEVTQAQIGQSPDNAASNARMAADAAASRAVQIRGQDLADARALDVGGQEAGAAQASLVKIYGKAPAGYRWAKDGSLEVIPGGPTDRKTNEQQAGKETVDSVVANLRSSYDQLEKGGGITSTNKGALENIGAATSRSAVGQVIGSTLGTKNQKERDAIAQARPLLLQAIMKATGMSAKQMDSNAELKLYLATATDPTLSLEANREALDRIVSLYGSGGKAGQAPAKSVNWGDMK
jgi:hypothetical protein